MVELVLVIMIMGVVSVTALSRFTSQTTFDERGFTDTTLAAVHYGHRLATVGGCDLRVQLSGGNLTLSRWSDCVPADHSAATIAINHPDNLGTFVRAIPSGVVTGDLDIYFDGRGRPYNTATATLTTISTTVSIGATTLTIQPETGYAHD